MPDPPQNAPRRARIEKAGRLGLMLGALGVVFGDIGTSPLYALQTVFSLDGGVVTPTETDVYGVISLVFWAITLIVSVKYVTFILRADNDGEGGIMALTALVQIARARATWLVLLGIFGAALFYGDGVITPAISVLSAVEGVEVVSPSLADLVVPITLAVLVILFAVQRFGTRAVGGFFGPVMIVWFVAIGVAGLREVIEDPAIIRGLSPTYAADFIVEDPFLAFIAGGAVVLAITGAEALYADMGHFGPSPIRRAWFWLVFPALTLNYLGQGALILRDPTAIDSPFFLLLPHWARVPMVVLATLATVIASQSVISGAFSVTRQAVSLGFLPRMTIRHTSAREIGQVYVPLVNWILFAAVVGLVLAFQSSERLAAAYGIAVTGTFIVNTILFLAVTHWRWHWPVWRSAVFGAVFLGIEVTLFAANVTKIPHGGWVALLLAAVVFVVLATWRRGRAIVTGRRTTEEGPLSEFVAAIDAASPPIERVPGTAVFLHPSIETTPLALRANLEHNHVLHRSIVILMVESVNVPHVSGGERVRIDPLGDPADGITHVTARIGFMDRPAVPQALRLARAQGLECDADIAHATYFLSHIDIQPTRGPGMMLWRKRLFAGIARNAASPVEYFGLPPERTIQIGSEIPL
jgi:KUP system potassium uptake protein